MALCLQREGRLLKKRSSRMSKSRPGEDREGVSKG